MSIYGILIGISIVIGIELIRKYNKQISYIEILISLIITLIFARLLFLLHNIEEIKDGLINPFAVWEGGLAFYGALIGLLFSLFILSKRKDIPYLKLSDSTLLFLPLIQAIGRIGNFFNYELYGKPSSLPWSIYIPIEHRLKEYIQYSHYHPVFIYESILNVLHFLLLMYIYKKNKKRGLITGVYLITYSLIRLFMNTLRIDKEYIFNIETSDLLSILFLLFCILIILNTIKENKIKDLIAIFFSRVVTISLVILASISVALKTDIPLHQSILLSFLTFVVPMFVILLFRIMGITSDLNITRREERPRLFFVLAICFFSAFFIAIHINNPQLIEIYSILNITFFLGFLFTLYWKISFHMLWSLLSIFIVIYLFEIPQAYLLILLLPFIAWSRLQLKRHSLIQVIAGTLLTLFCIFFVLTFLKF